MAKKDRKKLGWAGLALGILVVGVIAAAVGLNLEVDNDTTGKIAESIDVDNGDLKINWERYQTTDVELEEDLTISKSGTYRLTGTLEDGSVMIDAGVGEVRLILDNASITNASGPAIICYNAEDLVIETVGESYLANGTTISGYDSDVDGVIYSKADLAFAGEGTLNIRSDYGDGIVGKDDVTFRSGTYNISAADDGIRGKDSVHIADGTVLIDAAADGIKSTNEDDFGKGFVMVEGGVVEIVAGAKGLKAPKTVIIYGGEITVDAYDDAVHSNNYVGVVDGSLSLVSGDDGVHADRELIIDGGTVKIEKSYEGLEAQAITINGGEINVSASDDGLNAGGGADNSTTSNPRGGGNDPFAGDESCVLAINGGSIYVNAAGDGIDSNGYLYFNGGSVVVDGPTNNGNGALDAGLGITMQGGTVIAVGSSGMAETLGASSGVCNLSIYFNGAQAAGTSVEVRDSNGNTVLAHTAAKTFNHLAAGSEALTPGETYTVYLNGEEYQSFTISEVTTVIGNSNVNQHNMPGGRR